MSDVTDGPPVSERPVRSGPAAFRSSEELFEEFFTSRRRSIRNELVERHTGLAIHIANRLSSAGTADDDLRQVALLALVKAVDRFDPGRGVPFSGFAGRTIEGEIKRHYRDRTWAVAVPRSAKELYLAVRRANERLAQTLGRSPTIDEVAEHLEISRDDVVIGLSAAIAKSSEALDAPVGDDGSATRGHAALATTESGYVDTDDRHAVAALLAVLPERERQIVELRFFEDLSQHEIAERVGMSQMHVSRLLRKAFEMMRGADPEM